MAPLAAAAVGACWHALSVVMCAYGMGQNRTWTTTSKQQEQQSQQQHTSNVFRWAFFEEVQRLLALTHARVTLPRTS